MRRFDHMIIEQDIQFSQAGLGALRNFLPSETHQESIQSRKRNVGRGPSGFSHAMGNALETAPPIARGSQVHGPYERSGCEMTDDRAEFDAEKRKHASEMDADEAMQIHARNFLVGADRHNWSYQWTWLGLPIIQLPSDIVAMQEVIWNSKPDLIIETGVARGGSLILSASMLQLLGRGRVLGIDVDIRDHNRRAIESHPLAGRISLLEGSSLDERIIAEASRHAEQANRVMVVLDSNHTHSHVLSELLAYSPLVSVGQYLVVCDTVVEDLPPQDHRPRPWGPGNNPATALREFLHEHRDFEADGDIEDKLLISSSPGGYLHRLQGDS